MSKVSDAQLQDILEHIGNNRFIPQVVRQFDKSMLFSTDEKVVGQWVDGKPLYQKTFEYAGSAINSSGTRLLQTELAECDNLFKVGSATFKNSYSTLESEYYISGSDYQIAKLDKYGGSWSLYAKAANRTVTGLIITLQYTKTTDTALPYELGDENDYSTTEKLVGKWIDGKPIYQKTINVSSFSVGDNAIPHGISNLDTVINLSGSAKRVGDGFKFSIPTIYTDNPSVWSIAPSGVTETSVKLTIGTGFTGTYVLSDVKITIQYTKTTD